MVIPKTSGPRSKDQIYVAGKAIRPAVNGWIAVIWIVRRHI